VSLPEQEMHTASFWVTFPQDLSEILRVSNEKMAGALYGASHILRQIVPVWALSDPADIRAYSMIRSPFTNLPTIYIYETIPGGVGFSRRIYDMFDDIVEGAMSLIKKCGCKDGCPSCVGPELEVGAGGKSAAQRVLRILLKK